MDNEKCNMNTALAELNLRNSNMDLAKARNEIVYLLRYLMPEAIYEANSNPWGVVLLLLRHQKEDPTAIGTSSS